MDEEKENFDNCSDRDLLIKTHTTVNRIDKWCYNHDQHHQKREVLAWQIAIGLIISLVLVIVAAIK